MAGIMLETLTEGNGQVVEIVADVSIHIGSPQVHDNNMELNNQLSEDRTKL